MSYKLKQKCMKVYSDGSEVAIDAMKGTDGVSPTITISDIDGGHKLTVKDKNGDKSFEILDGSKVTSSDIVNALGYTPLEEVPDNYRTAEEQDEIHDDTKADKSELDTEIETRKTEDNYIGSYADDIMAELTAFEDGYHNDNLVSKSLLDTENCKLNVVNNTMVYKYDEYSNGRNIYIMPVQPSTRYVFSIEVGQILLLKIDRNTTVYPYVFNDVNNATTTEETYYLAFNCTPSEYENLIISEGSSLSDNVTLPKWSDAKQDVITDLEDIRTKANNAATANDLENVSASVDYAKNLAQEAKDGLSSKQDSISDLETIRSGAALGATALQSVPDTYRTAAAQDAIHDSTKLDATPSTWPTWDGDAMTAARSAIGIVSMTAEDYALITPDDDTVYLIVG